MEAQKPDYFVDGFMLKHYGVWPHGITKTDLFYEQKVFLVYLMGFVPSIDDWSIQVEYKSEKQRIESLTLDDIELSKTDIDIAKMHNKNLHEMEKERLLNEKETQLHELNKKYGIKEPEEEPEIKGLPKNTDQNERDKQQELWEMLQGKGIIKEKTGDK